MRNQMLALVALSTIGAATMIGAGPAAAFDYPYCLQGKDFGIPGQCDYRSYAECKTAASGRGLYCGINPRVAFRQPSPYQGRGRPYPAYDYND